jgi:hypothetical protein
MKWTSTIFLALPVVLLSCIKTDLNIGSHKADSSGLTVKAGFVCGWGSGTDSLEISNVEIKYSYYVPSSSSEAVIRKSRSVSEVEWTEILNAVNKAEFAKLDYQTCNVCFDGCDEWISVEQDTYSHKITFGKGSSIETISNLQSKLADLRAEFNR